MFKTDINEEEEEYILLLLLLNLECVNIKKYL